MCVYMYCGYIIHMNAFANEMMQFLISKTAVLLLLEYTEHQVSFLGNPLKRVVNLDSLKRFKLVFATNFEEQMSDNLLNTSI